MKTGLKVIFVSLPILLIILLLLNYFNIFSLSLLFPKQLGWLPQPSLSPPPVAPPPGLPSPPPFIRQ